MRTILPVLPTKKLTEAKECLKTRRDIIIALLELLAESRRFEEIGERDVIRAEQDAVNEQWIQPLRNLLAANQLGIEGDGGFLSNEQVWAITGILETNRERAKNRDFPPCLGEERDIACNLIATFGPALEVFAARRDADDEDRDFTPLLTLCRAYANPIQNK